MESILSIAKKYNLLVVEDAACGFGSKLNGKHVGTFGDTGCFSFHPRKAITTEVEVWLQQTIATWQKNNDLRIMAHPKLILATLGAKPYFSLIIHCLDITLG